MPGPGMPREPRHHTARRHFKLLVGGAVGALLLAWWLLYLSASWVASYLLQPH